MFSRPFSLLLPLCFVSALALNAYAALDPTGVYQPYLAQLDRATPPVAAMASALADGVYPWSSPAPEPQPAPAPPEPAPEPAPDLAPDPGVESASPFTQVDADYFDDALFIGDSHTDGFKDYAGLPNADYLCHNGLTVWSAAEKAVFSTGSGKQTLAQALSGRRYGKVYLMLGINELGTGSAEDWAAQYKVLLDLVRSCEPDAVIFLQAIFHTTQEKSETSFFKNETINARNAELQKLADGKNVFYIDCNPVFDDASGALTASYSGDGVHVKAAYYTMWRDYLYQFGVVRADGEKTDGPGSPDEVPSPDEDLAAGELPAAL